MFQLPAASRMMRVINPANGWAWNEILLNKAVYYLETLAWQKTKDGQKKNPQHQPKLHMPSFMKPPVDKDTEIETHDVDDIKRLLAMPRRE